MSVMRKVKAFLIGRARSLNRSLFQTLPGGAADGRLHRSAPVSLEGRELFRICDFGITTRMRADSFETKEPETVRWISSFAKDSRLIDVGANVGLFSLFAASLGHRVLAIEPDALNFALLQQNIRLNQSAVGDRVSSLPLALHSEFKISTLNLSSTEWGGALSSFDNEVDFKGDRFTPVLRQGVLGMRLDDLTTRLQFEPTHLKIDVDGNEGEVLDGALKVLLSSALKSILIELDERRSDYMRSCQAIESAGFTLVEKTRGSAHLGGDFAMSCNHVFVRQPMKLS